MRNFLCGILVCLSFFILLGMTAVETKYKDEGQISNEFRNVYLNMQSKNFNVLTTTPTYKDFREGEMFLVNSEGVKHLFTRVGDKLYKVLLTEN